MIGRGVAIVLVFLVLTSPNIILLNLKTPNVNYISNIEDRSFETSIVEYNEAVAIFSDADFASQGWPGNGTKNSPYLISNLRFSNTEDKPIQIYNIQAYFVVNSCTIDPPEIGQSASDSAAIFFIDVSNGIVENCEFNAIGYGIAGWNLNDTTIRNNRFSDCGTSLNVNNLLRCNISENTIVECAVGIVLNPYCINNTLRQNRIGWCTESNAKDSGSGNIWIGNSWSDWDGVGSYLISGSAGSIDNSPALFDEDVLGPTFEYRSYNGIIADLIEPLDSFTFVANVTDASGVASVSLFIREMHIIDASHFQFQWVEYIMEHQPVAGNPNRYVYTFDCDGSFSATYVFFAIDMLGYWRYTEVDRFSFGCCLAYYSGYPLIAASFILLIFILVFGAAVIVILVKRHKS